MSQLTNIVKTCVTAPSTDMFASINYNTIKGYSNQNNAERMHIYDVDVQERKESQIVALS